MKVQFDNVLVCDVVKYDYEGKEYFKLLVYQQGQLYSLGIDSAVVDECKALIGTRSSFDTEMKSYDGKNKFKVVL